MRARGVGLLMVEQNARRSLNIADRGYLIETGRIVGEGGAEALKVDPAVQRVYLGTGEVHIAQPSPVMGGPADARDQS